MSVYNFGAFLSLLRIQNCIMALVAVGIGAYLLPGLQPAKAHPLAMAAAFFVCGLGNIVNDIFDRVSDRENHPRRALPSGRVTAKGASLLASIFLIISLFLTIPLDDLSRVIVIGAIVLVYLYNKWLKHLPYIGNLVVSVLTGLTFILGGTSAAGTKALELPGPIIAAGFSVLLNFTRELVKDIADRQGDSRGGSHTAPVTFGVRQTTMVALGASLVLAGACIWVYILNWFNEFYLWITLGVVLVPLLGEMVWLSVRPTQGVSGKISVLLKIHMIGGLAALFWGKAY